MPSYPTVDEPRDRLRRAGWSLGEIAFGPPPAPPAEAKPKKKSKGKKGK
jgi:hypothetical protein